MLVIHNGNEFNVTNKLTLAQLLKYGAVAVGEPTNTTEDVEVEEKKEIKTSNRKK